MKRSFAKPSYEKEKQNKDNRNYTEGRGLCTYPRELKKQEPVITVLGAGYSEVQIVPGNM